MGKGKQIRVSEKSHETLELLAKASGKTVLDVTNDAVELLREYINAYSDGKRVIFEDPNGPDQRLEIRFLGYKGIKID
jgi:hypothetical protein